MPPTSYELRNLDLMTLHLSQCSAVVTYFSLAAANLPTQEGWTAWLTMLAPEVEPGPLTHGECKPKAHDFTHSSTQTGITNETIISQSPQSVTTQFLLLTAMSGPNKVIVDFE
jgi:hypothetical protein